MSRTRWIVFPGRVARAMRQRLDIKKKIGSVFSGGSDGKASVYNAGDLGSIPGSGRFPGEGNGTPLQCSCLENPMDGGAWCPWGRKESDMTERLHFTHSLGKRSLGWFLKRMLAW